MEKEIRLTIQIKTMDMFRFFMKHFYSGFSGIFGVILSVGAMGFLLATFQSRDEFQILILAVLASLFTVLQPIQFLMKAYQQVHMMPLYKAPIDYIFNDAGIHVKQNEETVDLPWDKIYKVVEGGKGLYIYNSPVHSFIFPKNQMNDNTENVKAFLKEKVVAVKCKLK